MRTVNLIVVIDLIDHQQHLFRTAPQQVGNHHIQIGNSGGDFYHKNHDVAFIDSEQNLLADLLFEDILAAEGISAGIDDRKFTSVPVGSTVMTVARSARRVVDDRLAHAYQPVKQRALAYVRAPHYRYYAHINSESGFLRANLRASQRY